MPPLLWLLLSPVVFVLPGLLPARFVTGRRIGGDTLLWAFFFSLVLLPPICFGLAMLVGTTVNDPLILLVALALGVPGLFLPRRFTGNRTDARDGHL